MDKLVELVNALTTRSIERGESPALQPVVVPGNVTSQTIFIRDFEHGSGLS